MKLQLVGRFTACDDDGDPITIPPTGARLLALLALHRHGLTRGCVGGMLWPDHDEDRAAANLRSALWRLKTTRSIAIVDREPAVMALAQGVHVDIEDIGAHTVGDDVTLDQLLCDLLDGWDDSWVEPFRLRWRQTRLHAIDARCQQLIERQAYAEAVMMARTVLMVEPLRESILRLLVVAEMRRQQPTSAAIAIDDYRRRLERELGAQISPTMQELASEVATQVA